MIPDKSQTASNGLRHYDRLFGRTQGKTLDHQSLPDPAQYLAGRGLLKERSKGTWLSIVCPVHKGGGEDNPSMRVNAADGHFKCMACGESGGDIVALHRLITGMGFIDAVRDLGGRFHE